jgi:integrase
MAHIVQRKDRFYVVAYDGIDPLTGRERRRWHAVGDDPAEAEAMAARLHRASRSVADRYRLETRLPRLPHQLWLSHR